MKSRIFFFGFLVMLLAVVGCGRDSGMNPISAGSNLTAPTTGTKPRTALALVTTSETAFALGDRTFIQLGISNRWGWEIKVSQTGAGTAPIYAGAGGNNISAGTLVGTLRYEYDGSTVTVTYTINSGYEMSHTHLYVGTTTWFTGNVPFGPGQFGNQHELSRATSDSYTISISGLPIYLIAHADVNAASTSTDPGTAGGGTSGSTGGGTTGVTPPNVYPPPVTHGISGVVFFDTDQDGSRVSGEQGIGGIAVTLKDGSGNTVATATSAPDGSFSFTGLANGTYTVVTDPQGTLSGLASTTGGGSRSVTVSGSNGTADFGYRLPEAAGTVYFDANRDGSLSPGERGIGSIAVIIKDATGNTIADATTDAGGSYTLTNIYPGSYTVAVDPQGTLAGLTSTTGLSRNATVGYADLNGIDFGYRLPQIAGTVYFDVTRNGLRGADEPGIQGVSVSLSGSNGGSSASVTTDANGAYRFEVYPGAYTVYATAPQGTTPTTPAGVSLTVGYASASVDFGVALNLASLNGLTANGFTIGYWKTNLDKAISGTTRGVQVSAATIFGYVSRIAGFDIEPFQGITPAGAASVLSATGSNPVDLLKKQLIGSEFNYMNTAYIGGNRTLTLLFLHYGEYIAKRPGEFTSSQILNAKDWFDAYNNTHGGAIVGPAF